MAFKDRLKEARLNNNMTQEQIAAKIGVAKSTFTGYEKGNSEPNMNTISKVMNVLKVDANFLWQDEMDALGGNPVKLKYEEMEHIKKYRSLDQHGQETVSYILERELDHKNQIESARNSKQTVIDYPTRFMTYYHNLASAGTGEYIFDDLPIDTIEIPANELSERADFVIGVNGDSMEPTYYDGDKVYVEKCPSVEIGDIGIFMVNNECFIKEVGKDGLIPHNKKYSLIPGGDNVQCIGKVLGKVEE